MPSIKSANFFYGEGIFFRISFKFLIMRYFPKNISFTLIFQDNLSLIMLIDYWTTQKLG